MATITSTANGNWSSGSTWVGGVAPGIGDTAVIAHNVTVNTNITVGTSPNDTSTAVITLNASKVLTIAASVTLTVRGNQAWTNGSGLVMGAGSQMVFDNAASGGSPVYRITGAGIYTLSAVGTSGSRCSISAISGQAWQFHNGSARYIAWSSLTATYCDFIRMGDGQAGFQIFSGTSAFSGCAFTSCRDTIFFGTGTSITLTVDNCTWSGTTLNGGSCVNMQLTGTFSSGTRRFSGNVLDGTFTYLSKGFTLERNYFKGITPLASSSYDWSRFRLNCVHSSGAENSGNGQIIVGDVDRNYWVEEKSSGNPHFISATALITSQNRTISQNVFESQSPDLVDIGDCVIVNPSATSGSNKIVLKNNIVAIAKDNESSGTLLTIYANNSAVTEHERNTVNVNTSAVGGVGKRGAFAFAEASNGGAGQVAVLKSNLVHGTSASQGYLGERVQGTVLNIVTAAGADRNWRFNTSDGDNGRGYEDKSGSGNLWTAGNAAAAGVDANQGSGNPAFVDVTRTSVTWAVARGYGSTFADAVTAIKADTSRVADLINYVFEGHKPSAAGCRTAAHDGACVGAANWHDTTRTLTAATALYSELSTAWLA